MKVVHIVKSSDGIKIRGDQRHVFYLAGAQLSKGFNVTVMTDNPGPFGELCREQGIQVVTTHFEPPDFASLGTSDSISGRAEEKMISQLGNLEPDLIHCHDLRSAFTAISAGNKMQLPCLLTLHLPPNLMLSYLRSRSTFAVLSLSKAVFDRLKESDIPQEDLYYVPNGTPNGVKTASTISWDEAPDTHPSLITVGRITFDKGIDTAMFAMFELRRKLGDRCPDLNIYGDSGEELEYFREIASVLGVNDIVNFNEAQLDILDHCRQSDILLVSSRFETGPLIVLEAMSRGMPIVSSDVGDVADMIPDARYGRVVPAESIAELADAINSTLADIADSRFDPNLLIERHQALYTSERMAECIELVYERVLEKLQGTVLNARTGNRCRDPASVQLSQGHSCTCGW